MTVPVEARPNSIQGQDSHIAYDIASKLHDAQPFPPWLSP